MQYCTTINTYYCNFEKSLEQGVGRIAVPHLPITAVCVYMLKCTSIILVVVKAIQLSQTSHNCKRSKPPSQLNGQDFHSLSLYI